MSEPFWNLFPDQPDWSLQTLRLLAAARAGGADTNEIYRTATTLQARTWRAWSRQWERLANEVNGYADRALEEGHASTARAHLFRACNYYRHAEFYVPEDEPRGLELYQRSRNAFRLAARTSGTGIEEIEIPYEDYLLDGYLVHPLEGTSNPAPVVILLGGADSTAEELYFLGGAEIAGRGVACLLVDTPGRGSAVRLKRIFSRPDYEVPVGAILDWVALNDQLDGGRVALWGVSMGGYYAARAASSLPAVRALACWCGCYDVVRDIYEFYPPLRHHLRKLTGASDEGGALREVLAPFTLAEAAQRITCPTLIVHAEADRLIDVRGAHDLYERISGPKRLELLPADGPGRLHCSWDHHPTVVPTMVDWLVDMLCDGGVA